MCRFALFSMPSHILLFCLCENVHEYNYIISSNEMHFISYAVSKLAFLTSSHMNQHQMAVYTRANYRMKTALH